jgi:K+ transporter
LLKINFLIFKVNFTSFFKTKFKLKKKDNSSSEEEEEEEIPSISNNISVLRNVSLSSLENINSDERRISVTPCVSCFLTDDSTNTPHVFENHVRLLHSIPQIIIFLRIQYARIPFIKKEKRLLIKLYGNNIYHICARFGYAEKKKKSIYSDILLLSAELYNIPIPLNENQINYFISNEIIFICKKGFYSYLNRWPLMIYSLQKSLLNRQNSFIQLNIKNTIQFGIIVEL